MQLPCFYPIFDSSEWLARLVPLGIKLVQLRIKDCSEEVLRSEIIEAMKICDQYNCTLVVNDYWQLAIELGCKWVHLGQEDLEAANVAEIKKAGLKLGISTHDETELQIALQQQPDYIALGPVYPTILKKMKWHEQGLDKVSEWKQKIGTIPLVAIGGMSVTRAPGAFDAGADIVSAVTDITLHEHPEERVKQWIEACNTANRVANT
ncbi:thiamine phosphate synthase [Glaciecola sp. 2405UD65-10]|uniref:thiamine phosphate synthase n=1 Tax=Glaciecola sp. 2405UD65-10 TaxID=3397244 RepID=UPI003B58E847